MQQQQPLQYLFVTSKQHAHAMCICKRPSRCYIYGYHVCHISSQSHGAVETDMFSGLGSTAQASQQPDSPFLYPRAAPFSNQIFQHWHGLALYDELIQAVISKVTT